MSGTSEQLRIELRHAVARAGGVRQFAERNGMASHSRVSTALNGGEISEAVANSIGYIKRTIFEKVNHG